jgi:hypothetical protein
MTKNMGLKSIHKFDALFKIATPAVKERYICANIIRRKGTQVSHMPSFPLASLFSFSKNFLPCAEYPFAHASRVYFVLRHSTQHGSKQFILLYLPLQMVQNNSFSIAFN